jgi:PKD repeat protein
MKLLFLVILLVTTITLTISMPVQATTPAGLFVAATTTGTAPLSVQFIDSSSGSPTSWSWSFGDSATSTEQNPAHIYTTAGTYTVTLTVTNADGSSTISKTGYVTVSDTVAAPVAAFGSSATTGTTPATIQFTDSSTNTPTSWVWSFGDGGTSTVQHPSHIYTTAGSYTVTLTATNAGGSNTVSKASYITVTNAATAPVASFYSATTSGTIPLTIQFADLSTNTPTSWTWSFGDGVTSTLQNPAHIYTTAGSYTVTLTATNAGGSNTVSQAAYITASDAEPVASFTSNVTSGTAPFSVLFTDTSTNTPTSWTWAFGDGGSSTEQNPVYEYESAGTYTVTLTAANSAGSNTTYTSSYITATAGSAPVTSFTADTRTGTSTLTVQFTDTSTNTPTSWYWVFGDGSTSTLQNPSHTFSSAGSYTVSLTAYNAAGSRLASQSDYITIKSREVVETIATVPVMTVASTIPITSQTTAPSKAAPTVTPNSATADATAADSSGTDLLLPAGIGLIIVGIIAIFFVLRGRNRSQRWDL